VAVERFRDQGYLPEALVNYLALLGWSYDEKATFFTREELIEKFDLARVSHNPAAFDREKLDWMNGHYIREASDQRLTELVLETLQRAGIAADRVTVAAAVPLVKKRMTLLSEAPGLLRFFSRRSSRTKRPEDARRSGRVPDRGGRPARGAARLVGEGDRGGTPDPSGRAEPLAPKGVPTHPRGCDRNSDLPSAVRVHGAPGSGAHNCPNPRRSSFLSQLSAAAASSGPDVTRQWFPASNR
jgi:hypothetical protein